MNVTADDILGIEDIPFRDVVVPEWNGVELRLRGMNGEDASKFSSGLVEVDGKGQVKAVKLEGFLPELLSMSIYTKDGQRVFTTDEQIKALGRKSAAVLKRLGDIAAELSGLNEHSVDGAGKN